MIFKLYAFMKSKFWEILAQALISLYDSQLFQAQDELERCLKIYQIQITPFLDQETEASNEEIA